MFGDPVGYQGNTGSAIHNGYTRFGSFHRVSDSTKCSLYTMREVRDF
jgi:hypothetical protein